MATVQEPEVQLAQRLASNEKPVRTKAMKKLRKYVTVRSQSATGGFTGDELLKLWKGLFYCLWMQDKPLLQEELSQRISGLLHSFHDVDGQLSYLESFLQTFKREWTGIDRLRMDKFYQLVRFMFRQTFEMLKRKNWDSSVVGRFLELLTAQILQSGCGAPSGLQFHILDLYLTELATVGSEELTADQNLVFIEPFCKTAARTKDRVLFRAICNSLFSTIIDQAPFAIEDLMREVKAAEELDSDSGQASEEEEEVKLTEKQTSKKKTKVAARQMNGIKSKGETDEEEGDEDDDELLHLEDSDTEEPCDEDVGPVLQFDYGALADKLLVFASRSSTPSQNRQRLYKIIKVLRDLSEGVFPQDEYPEEVSTDEDDDMFGSRKRMKKRRSNREEEEEAPPPKKSKGKKKEASAPEEQNNSSAKDSGEAAEITENENKNKKKRRKKKKKASGEDKSEQGVSEGGPESSQSAASSIEATESQKLLTEENSQPAACTGSKNNQSDGSELESTLELQTPVSTEPDVSSNATVSGKKKKNKKKGLKSQKEAEITAVSCDADVTTAAKNPTEVEAETQANGVTTEEDGPERTTDSATPSKKKSKSKNRKVEEEAEGTCTEAEITSVSEDVSPDSSAATLTKKRKKKTTTKVPPEEAAEESPETPLKSNNNQKEASEGKEGAAAEDIAMTTSAKKKKKKKKEVSAAQVEATEDQVVGDEDGELQPDEAEMPTKRKKRKIPVVFEFEADEVEAAAMNGLAEEATVAKKTRVVSDPAEPSTPKSAKKSLKKPKTPSGPESNFVTFQSNATAPTPLFCKTKGGLSTPLSSKKKCQTPKSESKKVTFGLKNNKTAEFRKTDRSLLVSPDGSSRVPFDPTQKPKFGVLKSPAAPLSARVKKTPNSTRKTTSCSSNNTPKRRPSAADFF